MQRPKIRGRGPEAKIQEDIIAMLHKKGWVVMVTHGNMYQRGFPDLYCLHEIYGQRWVEVKNPKKFTFTPAQRKYFPIIAQFGGGIWILVSAKESEYKKLMKGQNWYTFLFRPND